MVVLACAHPSKFPQAVPKAIGIKPPAVSRLMSVMEKAEHYMALPNDLEKVKGFIKQNANR
jgi:threonine synthase